MKKAPHLTWFLAVLTSLTLVFPAPLPGQAQSAGSISRLIPNVNLQHGMKVQLASAGAKVLWGDTIQTDPNGRARVALDDGSILNVGSNSNLRIVQHDAANQRTQIQLAYGRLRASAVRLARPNASFEVRTPTAVAGVVGTDFTTDYTNDISTVQVAEGSVNFCSLNAAPSGPQQSWRPGSTYSPGAQVVDENGNLHEVQAGGVSGNSAPAWNQAYGGTTTDNAIVWVNKGAAALLAQAAGGLRCVTVPAGYTSMVRGNNPPTEPTPTPPSATTDSVNSTSVPGGAGGGAAAGTAAGVSHSFLIIATVIGAVLVPAIVVPVTSSGTKCGCTTVLSGKGGPVNHP